MFLVRKSFSITNCRQVINSRYLSDGKKPDDKPELIYKKSEHPVDRTGRILSNDLKRMGNSVIDKFSMFRSETYKKHTVPIQTVDTFIQNKEKDTMFQSHCDVLIIGGGGVGSSIAYWLKKRARDGLNVVVLEKDPTVSNILHYFLITYLNYLICSTKMHPHHYPLVDLDNSFH